MPSIYQGLYEALTELKRKAAGQVDLSRLELALKGLESRTPTTRIALLGVNSHHIARRLTRLLLTDSSIPEQAWETRLVGQEAETNHAVIIRYGDFTVQSFESPRSVLPVLLVPSPILRNLELVISSITTPSFGSRKIRELSVPSGALLSPLLQTPISVDGRQSSIRLPVHRTILVAGRPDELLDLGGLLAATRFQSETERNLLDVVVDTNGDTSSAHSQVPYVDIAKSEDALQNFRNNTAIRAAENETRSRKCGIKAVFAFLTKSSAASTSTLAPSVREVVTALLETATVTVESQKDEAWVTARATTQQTNVQSSLEDAVTAFARYGHAELQSGLEAARSSRNWRKLAFWKLFWRVDDMPMIVNDLITNGCLPRTERAMFELAGQLKQVGIDIAAQPAHRINLSPLVPSELHPTTSALPARTLLGDSKKDTSPLSQAPPGTTVPPTPNTTSVLSSTTWASLNTLPLTSIIAVCRQRLLASASNQLTSTAQLLVLQSISTTALSVALSALYYLTLRSDNINAITSTSALAETIINLFTVNNDSDTLIYESVSIFALGTVYALYRMQRQWRRQWHDLENHWIKDGKAAVRKTEERMRWLLRMRKQNTVEEERRGGVGGIDKENIEAVEAQIRKEASAAIARAKTELDKLDK